MAEEVGRKLEAVWILAAEPLLFSLAGSALRFSEVPQSTVLKGLLVVAAGARMPPGLVEPLFVTRTRAHKVRLPHVGGHFECTSLCSSGILVKVPVTFFGLTFTNLSWRERLMLALSALHMVGSWSTYTSGLEVIKPGSMLACVLSP